MRAAIDDLIRHRPPSLLSSPAQLTIRQRLYRGLKSAPIYQIIGRPARYDDLDRALASTRANPASDSTPPGRALIELYQVAETYFVQDGHRRVAEARARGQLFLLARVTECVIDGALDDPAEMHAQLLREEYRHFQAATDLAQLRPAVDAFFDKVTVNADDPSFRENRLKLLNRIRAATLAVADFSKIEG